MNCSTVQHQIQLSTHFTKILLWCIIFVTYFHHQLEKSTSQSLHDDEERFHHLASDHQEENHPLPKIQNVTSQASSPHCLVCNAKLGVSARGAMEVFSDKVCVWPYIIVYFTIKDDKLVAIADGF